MIGPILNQSYEGCAYLLKTNGSESRSGYGFFSQRSDPDPVFLGGWIRIRTFKAKIKEVLKYTEHFYC